MAGEGTRPSAGFMMARMTLTSISHSHPHPTSPLPVLDNLTFDIAAGEVIAIMGPSGSGKSTLLNIVAGREAPDSGTIRHASPPRISRVFQEPALLPWRTVFENVRLPLELLNDLGDADGRVARAMMLAAVSEFSSFFPRELSGGLASRVAIARALVTNPDLLLLDEPFGSLDEVTAEQVMLRIASIVESLGATAVLVSHSVEQAVFLADRVIVLSQRPARILATIVIEHPRPRTRAFLDQESFTRAVLAVRRELRAGVA